MPSPRDAQLLAERHLAGTGDRIAHVRGVAARVAALATDHPRRDELLAAAWLHDIGYAEDVVDGGFHPVDGARFAARAGFSTPVVSLVAYHSGAEFEAHERGIPDELLTFERPDPELLDLITLADLTTSPTGEFIGVEGRLREILQRYDVDHPVHRAVVQSSPSLRASARRAALALGIEFPA